MKSVQKSRRELALFEADVRRSLSSPVVLGFVLVELLGHSVVMPKETDPLLTGLTGSNF